MKKIGIFIYGILAYLVFLVSFLYAIGFVGDFLVPKTINTGTETTFSQALIVNLLLLSAFAIQHSVMARPAFKRWIVRYISPAIERSTYVLLSSLILLLIYWQWQPITTEVWSVENNTFVTVLNALFVLGWLIVFLSTFMINHFELFGLKQIVDNLKNEQTTPPPFQKNFFYKLVRHPIMLGFIVAFWATPHMTVGHLVFAITTTCYILVAVKFLEEKDLKKSLGEKYTAYQKEVPMLIPFLKFGKTKS
jgi:methanethiol S-methyltransferase